MGEVAPTSRVDPAAMSVDDMARLLSRVSGLRVTADDIRSEVEASAPTNSDGTINLVHYAAWLVRAGVPSGNGSAGGD